MNQQSLSALIWSVADLLRGDFRQSEYGRVVLPFTILRRLDCVLAPTKAAVLAEHQAKTEAGMPFEAFVLRQSCQTFYNVAPLDLPALIGDQDNLRANLHTYIQGFAADVRDIFEHFDFANTVERLHKANLLYLVSEKFAHLDLLPKHVDNVQMGLVFEELIRKFAEISNETAGEHFTPREVIRLMVNLLFIEDDDALTRPGIKGKLLECEVLIQQAVNNTKEQFASSPDLDARILDAVMDALSAFSSMSRQALESAKIRADIKAILLGPVGLYEALRGKGML